MAEMPRAEVEVRVGVIDEVAELKHRVAELTADRDNMKTWSTALFAHLCRLSGKNPKNAPREIEELARKWTDEVRAGGRIDAFEKLAVVAGNLQAQHARLAGETTEPRMKDLELGSMAAMQAFAMMLHALARGEAVL